MRFLRRARRVPRAAGTAGVAAAVLGTAAMAVRPWYRRWGASREELRRRLPGDDLPGRTTGTRAVTIHAAASEVWCWLVQIEQDRVGFYSYTWVKNGLFRAGIHNTERAVSEWQQLRKGDFVHAVRPDWMGGRYADRAGWRVADIEPGRYLVLEGWGPSCSSRSTRRAAGSSCGAMGRPCRSGWRRSGRWCSTRGTSSWSGR